MRMKGYRSARSTCSSIAAAVLPLTDTSTPTVVGSSTPHAVSAHRSAAGARRATHREDARHRAHQVRAGHFGVWIDAARDRIDRKDSERGGANQFVAAGDVGDVDRDRRGGDILSESNRCDFPVEEHREIRARDRFGRQSLHVLRRHVRRGELLLDFLQASSVAAIDVAARQALVTIDRLLIPSATDIDFGERLLHFGSIDVGGVDDGIELAARFVELSACATSFCARRLRAADADGLIVNASRRRAIASVLPALSAAL